MEPSSPQPLATDSFSYSWLTNPTPSFDALIKSLRPSFDNYIDSPLNEFVKNTHHNHQNDLNEDFDFSIVLPETKASDSLIHADELFSGGCIMPVYDPNQHATISVPTTPESSFTSITEFSQEKQRSPCFFFQKFKESSNRVLKKSFLIFYKLGCSREGVRVADLDRKVKEIRCQRAGSGAGAGAGAGAGTEVRAFASDIYRRNEIKRKSKKNEAYKRLRDVRSCNNSPLASPPPSLKLSPSMDHWHHVESSIDDAILHCKRSFASN